MINFFRSYNPFNFFWLVLILFITRISYVFQVPDKLQFVFMEPFARFMVPGTYEYMFTPTVNVLLAAAVVFIQALLINSLINSQNLLGKPTFLPAVMYITLSALFTPFLILSPPLICNFLIIWMLYKLFSIYKSGDAKSQAYDVGMIIALGSLIYFPFIYLFLSIWIGLIIFKPFDWREWVAGIFGVITVFFFLGVFYYLNDRMGQFYHIWAPLGSKFPTSFKINYYNYLVLIPVIVILLLGFVKLQSNFFKTYVQIRKSFQLLFVIFIIAGISFYVKPDFHLSHFVLCVPPVAIFFAYYFLYANRRWFYESLYLLLLISIIYFQFNTF